MAITFPFFVLYVSGMSHIFKDISLDEKLL